MQRAATMRCPGRTSLPRGGIALARQRRQRHPRDDRERQREPEWRAGVAPAELIRLDFKNMLASEVLRCTWHVEELIFVQSIEGHAYQGHAEFQGRRFVNTHVEDICTALGFSRHLVAQQRQRLIDDVVRWVDEVLAGADHDQLVNGDGEPFFGMSMLRSLTVNAREVLQGLYIGGLRDGVDVRMRVEDEYGIKVGGGASYFVDVGKMHQEGLDGDQLAHGHWEHDIERFRQIGLIRPEGEDHFETEDVRYMYIRHRQGCGHSDDAAILLTGMLHGFSAGVGAFIADAIDTIEKYVPRPSDQDEDIARRVAAKCPDLGVGPDDVMRVARLAANDERGGFVMPDCSLRHFLRLDREVDQNAIESHLLYLQDKPFAEMEIGHEHVVNGDLYEFLESKAEAA
jgi:hypothetical protein